MQRCLRVWTMLVILASAGCAGHVIYRTAAFSGRVIDSQTGEPLSGAAVVVVWYSAKPALGHPAEGLHDVVEVTTDALGNFVIPPKTHAVLRGEVRPPNIVAYYPGYKPFSGQAGQPPFLLDTPSSSTVRLVRAAPNERRRYADVPAGLPLVPESKTPHLKTLVDRERRSIGLDR